MRVSERASAPPAEVTALIGRERECVILRELLADARLVALTGPGGSGKTRLAAVTAADTADRFRDGACWIDLAAIDDPGLVTAALAAAVGVHERPADELVDTLIGHLADGELLVVLDNCEHLAETCAALVTRLLQDCPGVTVLATSREALAVAGETIFPVPPLSMPDEAARTAEEIGEAAAVRLFELRARQIQPSFRLDDGNAAAVGAICRHLDGMPLAIELAAARVRVLTPRQIAAGLSDRFQLLTDGTRDAPTRQRTLESSVAWSYDLLDEPLQLTLARLSVFAGSFGLDAAEAVVAGPGVDGPVLDLITGLVDRSLLQVGDRDGQARYRLLETIRLYARQRLGDLDEPARVRDRHLDVHLDLARRASVGLTSPQPEPWLERLAADLDDVRAAMDWAVASGRPLAVLDIAEPTFAFWMVRGLYVEMRRRLAAAVRAPAAGDAERARGLTTASILALMGGDYRTGHTFVAEAVPLARAVGDEATLARALVFRSWCGFFSGCGSTEQNHADSEEALALAARLGDPEILGRAQLYAGARLMAQDGIAEGQSLLQRTVGELEAAGLIYMLPPTHAFLGLLRAIAGRALDDARAHARRAVELGRQIGLHAFVSLGLAGGGVADVLQGREDSAREHLAEARAVAVRSALPTFEMLALRCIALAQARFGSPSEARRAAEEALEAAHRAGSRSDSAAAELLLGAAALREQRLETAQAHLECARDASLDPRYAYSLGRSLLGLAQLQQQSGGDLDLAWEQAHDALEVLAGAGDHAGVTDALESLAGVATPLGRPDHALRLLAAAARFRDETGIGRFPLEADRYEARRSAASSALAAEEAEACWADGTALDLVAAVAYARRGRGERARPQLGWHALTPAERDVVRLVADGCTNAEIGERLFVSVNTVKTHLSHVYAKVGIGSRAELAAEATRRHL
jgi:predicted ATPase/DNA-binding CsgD family transcriptional regulator